MRIALFCPNGPRHSPLVAYAQALVPLLAEEHEVTVILGPGSNGAETRPLDFSCETIPYDAWLTAPQEFDIAFYQLDPSRPHEFMFEALERHAGIAILHDIFPHQASQWGTVPKENASFASSELTTAYGMEKGATTAEVAAGCGGGIHRRRPILHHILDNSLAVIATREATAYEVQRFSPPGFPVYCIPSPIVALNEPLNRDPLLAERLPFVVPAPPPSEADTLLLQRAIDHLRHRWPQAVAIIIGEGLYRDALPLSLPSRGVWWPGDLPPSRWHSMMATACAAIFFSPLGGGLDASPIAQALAYGVCPIVIGDFEDPHLGQAALHIPREHPQNWAILAAALDYLLRYPQRFERFLTLGKQRALEHYGPQRARRALQALLADLAMQQPSCPARARQDVQDRLAIRESLSAFAGRALAELGITPTDKAILRPFASLIASLIPPASPSPEDETNQC